MSLSQSKKKLLRSLQLKKYRKEEQCFVVEGGKAVAELLTSDYKIEFIIATQEFYDQHEPLFVNSSVDASPASSDELRAAGSLQSNNTAIAVARMKPAFTPTVPSDNYIIALDDIRDPGNLGTIIRTADWFGINDIVASEETADFYNAKTISATMGSFTRVKVFYTDLDQWLQGQHVKRYGAFLDGKDVHDVRFQESGIVVIGNESNGISNAVAAHIDERVTIPRFGRAESLNAGLSTAVILDNLRRSQK